MYEQDKEAFAKLIADVCRSVNRPCSPEDIRVYWEDLQNVPFPAIERAAKAVRASGKKSFNSNDLRPPPEERAQLGGPDNHELLARLDRAFCRLFDRLSDNQRHLAQFHEYVWTNDRIAPRPIALIIKSDVVDLGDRQINYPGHRINVIDCDLTDWQDQQARPSIAREPGADDDFDEAAAARDLLNRTGAPGVLRP